MSSGMGIVTIVTPPVWVNQKNKLKMSPVQLVSRVARVSSLRKYVHVQEPDFSVCIYVEYDK